MNSSQGNTHTADIEKAPHENAVPAPSLTLEQAQTKVDEWIKTIGVRYFNELTNLGILMEEVGELSRLMVRQYGEQSFKQKETHLNTKQALSDEMADVLWVLLCLANQTGVNLTTALQQNFDKKTIRDKDRHKNNPALQTESGR
ncbi:NTP pyrophosphatase, house-cleaning of non-canonical NTPs [Arachidicoccus rhizosphaerae]|uniref:NTP pyrophosphatase, house-cleaning of non-canonical NTPs n=1 Tax=Arachidicoccus rhizosphaerae TaxID=551991 RepID=A0A1H4BK19_9BACT|nr:nucleotide pyrophosphohydrolase [Arachidicoccus rhizosphaerae]SEA48394.1 NTP pyrophosphatase, house-cleaning of non-canonical NTPs [Arachidicoccus rhizosphaerae]